MKISKEALKEIPVIETHSHLDWEWTDAPVTPTNLMDLCDSENLSYTMLIGASPENQIEEIRKRKERFGYILWVKPDDKRWLESYKKIILDNRDIIKGIKIHPNYDQYNAGVDTLGDLFEFAYKNNFVIVTHTQDNETSRANLFLPLLEKYPDIKLVLYHATPYKEALPLIKKFPNVYMDTSASAYGKDIMLKALDSVGQKKILFGIDSPLGFPTKGGKYQKHFRNVIEKEMALWVDYDEEILRDILYRNAIKLFGLNNLVV